MKNLMKHRVVAFNVLLMAMTLPLGAVVNHAQATPITPVSYDMKNGGTSTPGSSLRDDSYTGGTGNPAVPYSILVGGLGDLTDGITTSSNWDSTPGPWVGWSQSSVLNPQITFHFGNVYDINKVEIWVDGLYRPGSVDTKMGSLTQHFSVPTDGLILTNDQKEWLSYTTTGLSGDTLVLTLNDYNNPNNWNRDWILIGEVRFDGTPVSVPAIPEPATMALLGLGLIGMGAMRRKA